MPCFVDIHKKSSLSLTEIERELIEGSGNREGDGEELGGEEGNCDWGVNK